MHNGRRPSHRRILADTIRVTGAATVRHLQRNQIYLLTAIAYLDWRSVIDYAGSRIIRNQALLEHLDSVCADLFEVRLIEYCSDQKGEWRKTLT